MGDRLVLGLYWREFAVKYKLKVKDVLVFELQPRGLRVKMFNAATCTVILC